jgi:OmpA-OmpF porin, OOP family
VNPENENSKSTTSFTTYQKFDFVPGEKIIALEDFSKTEMGDFPLRWNTNSTGEIVQLEGHEGKWMMLQKDGVFLPEFITSLPENFTFQFDIACNQEFSFYSAPFYFDIVSLKTQKNYTDWKRFSRANKNGLEILFHPTNANASSGVSEYNLFENGVSTLKNQVYTKQFHAASNNVTRVAVWRQKQRVRIYLNEEKVWDVPKALSATTVYNSIVFALGSSPNAHDRYYIANLKLAVGATDTRNKLLTAGKFISRGILFNSNSDQIKPESYGALKDVANVLNENPALRVKIVGHTDADGDETSNLDLSKRRAEQVKSILNSEFGIDLSRMETDGKGESQPVDKNTTIEAKANNRRVEFIKL